MATPEAILRRRLTNGGIHQAMRPASYGRIRMAIKIASNLPTFFCQFIVYHYHS